MPNTEILDSSNASSILRADRKEANTQWRAVTEEYAIDMRDSVPPIWLRWGFALGEPQGYDEEQKSSTYICFREFNGQWYAQICTLRDYELLPDPSFEGSEVKASLTMKQHLLDAGFQVAGEDGIYVTVLDPRRTAGQGKNYRKYRTDIDPSLYVNAWIEAPHETYNVADLIFG
jgi:hypothetical protein